MRIIAKGREEIINFWKRPCSQDVSYRLMRYHVYEKSDEGDLLLNTVTGELILLDEVESVLLSSLPSTYRPEMDELIAHHFLVPELFDDARSIDQLRRILQKIRIRDSIKSFSILPTTTCNARCFYCYEAGFPRDTMTRETADRVVDFIELQHGNEKVIDLHWFGGEPTVGENIIDYICDRLVERGIEYRSRMISNGYLFSKEMARKAKEKWKLQNIQITLDGTEEIYNKTKAYINPERSPFLRVMDNIGFLLDEGIRVSVRMNLDFYNAEDLKGLICELASRFSQKKTFSAYVHELFEGQGFIPVSHEEIDRHRVVTLVDRMNRFIVEKGCRQAGGLEFQSGLPSLKNHHCMADSPNSVMINPLGQLGKCEHELYCHLVGDVIQGFDRHSSSAQYWLRPVYRSTCQICPLYPFCGRMISCQNEGDCISERSDSNIQAVRKLMQSRLLSHES